MPIVSGLHYFESGADRITRPPIVLLHGAGGDHLFWPPPIRRLADQRIFAPDLPGHGRSPGLGRQAISEYTAEVRRLLQALGLSTVVMVGHSMGAAIALDMAVRFPKQVLALVLVGGGARLPVSPDLIRSTSDPAAFPEAVELLTQLSFGRAAGTNLKRLGANRLSQARPLVLHGDLLACDAFDIHERLRELALPALVVCGEDDKMTPPAYSAYLAQHIRGARLEILPRAGHMVMLEQPEAVADRLRSFVEELPYRPGT